MEPQNHTAVLALTAAAIGCGATCLRCAPAAGQAGGAAASGEARAESGPADLAWMRIACEQARLSPPVDTAYCVGCVLVKDGKAIATGFSRELPGNTHAEQCALMKAGAEAEGSDVYCTMEPCSKRASSPTGCCMRIIQHKCRRVYIGAMEPAHFQVCEGVRIMQEAGIDVVRLEAPGLEEECLAPNQHVLGKLN